jgi:hypothetical protein
MQNNKKKNQASKSEKQISKVPVARGLVSKTSRVSVSGSGNVVRVVHKEFVGTITNGSTTGYSLTALSAATPGYDINPAAGQLFPWLSGLSVNFERYAFKSLKFKFVPSQASTTAGRFYAAVDYDYDDPVAVSKAQLMGNRTAMELPVWLEGELVCIPGELHRDVPVKYVNLAGRSNYIEPRTSFCGFLMCAFDTPTANLLYDLWVEYVVELHLPVVEQSLVQASLPATAYEPVTDVASIGGGATKYGYLPLANLTASAIKFVIPGNGSVPILDLVSLVGASFRPPAAMDVGNVPHTSKLDFNTEVSVTGGAPQSVYATNNLSTQLYAFNQDGVYLGPIVPDSLAQGAKTSTQMATASAICSLTRSYFMTSAFSAYPTLRYIIPAVVSAAALGAGFVGGGLTFQL